MSSNTPALPLLSAVVAPTFSSITSLPPAYTVPPARSAQSTYSIKTDTSLFVKGGSTAFPPKADEVVVVAPGSHLVKIGRATDSFCRGYPQAIAYRRRGKPLQSKAADREDMSIKFEKEALDALLDTRAKQARRKVSPNTYASLVSYNRAVRPEEILTHNDPFAFEWMHPTDDTSVLVGTDALRLEEPDGHELVWPMRYGRFNTGRPARQSAHDMAEIWCRLLLADFNICSQDTSLMLVIPDAWSRGEIKCMVDELFRARRFRCIALIQVLCICSRSSRRSRSHRPLVPASRLPSWSIWEPKRHHWCASKMAVSFQRRV